MRTRARSSSTKPMVVSAASARMAMPPSEEAASCKLRSARTDCATAASPRRPPATQRMAERGPKTFIIPTS